MATLQERLARIVEDNELQPTPRDGLDAEIAAACADLRLDHGTEDDTGRAYVTIDNPDSRDLDQAVHVEATASGFIVRYAIADASFYVPVGASRVWQRSVEMGSSFYLPGFAIPMLPEAFSEGIVSLNPGVTRRALRFELHVSPEGECTRCEIERVRIRSRGKLSYVGVQAWYDGVSTVEQRKVVAACASDPGVETSLRALEDVGERLVAAAERRNTTPINRVESQVSVDPDNPERLVITSRERNQVERYNEQVSLLTNIEGAKKLVALGRSTDDVQAVFRVHLPPLAKRLESLGETLGALRKHRGLGDRWAWQRSGATDLAAFLRQLPSASEYERLRAAIHRQVRYTFRSSEFRARSGPHHALGVDGYARLSAPMREAVGVFTHKELLEGMGRVPPSNSLADEATRAAVIESANRSRQRQRAVDKAVDLLAIEDLFSSDLEWDRESRTWHSATVIGLRSSRLYVSLDSSALDIKVYRQDLERLSGSRYRLVDDACLAPDAEGASSFVLGDGVRVRVEDRDRSSGRFILRVAQLARDPRE